MSAASASGLSVAESEDEKLERLGVFEQMQPGHEIIYGVMTGGGMERSYGAIAASWCAAGPHLTRCAPSNPSVHSVLSAPPLERLHRVCVLQVRGHQPRVRLLLERLDVARPRGRRAATTERPAD